MWDSILPNSCCGYSLQTGCKIAALVQLVIAFPLLILSIKDLSYSNALVVTVASGTFVLVQIVQLVFAGCLFNGSKERHLPSCQIWGTVCTITTVASVVFISVRILFGASSPSASPTILIILSTISIFVNFGCLWVNLGFIRNLVQEEGEGGTVYNTE